MSKRMSKRPSAEGLDRFTPGLEVADPCLAYWLAQVNLRLRRELAWCWYQRTGQADPDSGVLPPFTGIADDMLAWSRSDAQRRQFFEQDRTASFLSELIDAPAPEGEVRYRGDWSWLVETLGLNEADQFVLALAVAHRLDAGVGPVCAAAVNDINRAYPSLALAQRLWDEPAEVLSLASDRHALRRFGLLPRAQGDWQAELQLAAWLAEGLLAGYDEWIGSEEIVPRRRQLPDNWAVTLRVLAEPVEGLSRAPLIGPRDGDYLDHCGAVSAALEVRMLAVHAAAWQADQLEELLCWCWLNGVEPVLPWGAAVDPARWPRTLPVRVWQPMSPQQYQESEPGGQLLAPLALPAVDFERRLDILQQSLGSGAARHAAAVEDCARRFRFSESTLRRIAEGVRHLGRWDAADLVQACRTETRSELAQLTQQVEPRFRPEELVLAGEQQAQFDEVVRAMDSLTQVHYRWGTARAWNEGGLSVLFCGPPGTGKTMAAEALATRLQLDMYRVDLAQVVSKYVGDTEKNLRRIFDAAEASDCLLFFDEADALFGKRTEVKDAHDRYANIEISYLLERMERFKGLAILASNRRKDMDEAFMRRLRYAIEFPVPGVDERERIWRQGFPESVDTGDLDFRFLARQFAFSGGHIRSVIFNACLQAAAEPEGEPAEGKVGRPSMRQVLIQVRRELQKLNRSAGDDLFGVYARLLLEEAA